MSSAVSRDALHPRVNAFELRCNCPELCRQWRVDGAAIDDRELASRLPSPRMFGGTSDVQGSPAVWGCGCGPGCATVVAPCSARCLRGGAVQEAAPVGVVRGAAEVVGAAGGADDDKVGIAPAMSVQAGGFCAGSLGRGYASCRLLGGRHPFPATVSPRRGRITVVAQGMPRDFSARSRSVIGKHREPIPQVDPGAVHIGSPRNVHIHALPEVGFLRVGLMCGYPEWPRI